MRSLLRALPWVAGVVVVLQFVFLGLLVAAAAVPDRAIVDDLAVDVRTGAYGPNGAPDGMGGRSTSYTDCVSAGTGLGRPGYSVFERAVRMPRLSNCSDGAEQIQALARGESVTEPQEYFRYWAGYTVITRPVIALAGLDGVRLVSGALFGLSLVVMVLSVSRVTNSAYALAITAPLLVSSNVLSVPSSGFSHALSLAVTFGGVALVAWASRFSGRLMLCAVAASACIFNFVDLLTTPAIAWAMTAAVVGGATFAASASTRNTLWSVLVAGAVWPVAFAITWVSRWLFAAAFLGWDYVWETVLGIARFRVGGAYDTVSQTFGAAIPRNWETWRELPVMPELVLLVTVVASLGSLVAAWHRFGVAQLPAAAVLAAPALVVPVWLAILSNHSQIHHHFVYRSIPAAVGVVFGACVLAATVGARRRPRGGPRSATELAPESQR
jgi:hypothetical protein